MRSALTVGVVLIASLLSETIANPVLAPNLSNVHEKRVFASLNPTTVLPDPTPTDASPVIDTGVLNCQKGCRGGYHNCLASRGTVPSTQYSNRQTSIPTSATVSKSYANNNACYCLIVRGFNQSACQIASSN